jgi:predicted helicase
VKILHADLYGLREEKYRALEQMDVATTPWTEIQPKTPWYLFKPFDDSLWSEYGEWWKVNDVFPVNSVGIVTARDKLTIHFTPEEVWETVQDFVSMDENLARRKYNLGKDAQDWKVSLAQKDLKDSGPTKENIVPILYRPFDIRYTYYTGRSRGFLCMPRPEVMRHMLGAADNAMLITRRKIIAGRPTYFFASACVIGDGVIRSDNHGSESGFPLYLYPTGDLALETERVPNLHPQFLSALAGALGAEEGEEAFTPEQVFYYIYAVFHSPTYRSRYEEFLAIDFPRVPLPGGREVFHQLAHIGEELVALHLLRTSGPHLPNFPVAGSNVVERVRYEGPSENQAMGRVWMNSEQYFDNVPPEAWRFSIGGYQVCEKWLKDRKGRKLSGEELETYRKIVANIVETIRLMSAVDAAIESHGGWPGAFA